MVGEGEVMSLFTSTVVDPDEARRLIEDPRLAAAGSLAAATGWSFEEAYRAIKLVQETPLAVQTMRVLKPPGPSLITLRVVGTPKPAGSKDRFVAYGKDAAGQKVPLRNERGGIKTYVTDGSGAPGKKWRKVVAEAADRARDGDELLDGPLYVEMTFVVCRPKNHFGTGRNAEVLKDSAPAFPAVKPDVLKLARAVEDSLTSTMWRDDSRIVSGPYEKVYAEPDEDTGVEVRVWRLPATVGELRSQRELAVTFPQASL